MAQSAITVTPPNPTPPTNFGFVGSTPPNPATYHPGVYDRPPSQTPPFFDDGTAGALTEFVSAHPLLAVGGTSVEHEGRGTEVVVTAPGSRAECPTQSFSCLGNYTNAPNQQHASSLSPSTNPALASISPTSTVSGAGTQLLTCTGTNFTRQSVIYVNGVAQTTTFVSATSLTATVTKKASSGTWPVVVKTGGVVETAAQTWTFT